MLPLSDKLKALGVKVGARDLPSKAPEKTNDYPLERVIPGQVWPTPAGDAFVVETWYDPTYRHGQVGLRPAAPLHTVAAWAKERAISEQPLDTLAFLDIETTGMGGSGTYAFLVGVGRFEGEQFRLAQFFMRDPAEEPAQLAALTDFLAPCHTLVTFNGKSFDAPVLNSRYISNGDRFPLLDAPHLDLLHLARRLWRDRLPSRRLGALETHILGATRTEEDTPGFLIPTIYFNYVRDRDARPLKGVFYHNALDVLAMAALLTHIAGMLADPLDGSLDHALDMIAVGKLFEALGEAALAAQLFEAGLQRPDLPEASHWATQERLGRLHRRQGNFEAAVEIWQQAAEGRRIYAHVELAKYYEHKQKDPATAQRWTAAALEIIDGYHPGHTERRRWRKGLAHRLARLERKVARLV